MIKNKDILLMLKMDLLRHGQGIWILKNKFRRWAYSDEHNIRPNNPTGLPLVYELDCNSRANPKDYIGGEEGIKKATKTVAVQISQTSQTP